MASSSDLVEVRPYADADARAIAELYNRHPDAPNFVDRELDAETVRAELAERGTVLFLVAQLEGAVLGTIGMFRTSGRRAVAAGEVFGDMFFLSPRIRGGAVAGRMFSQAFRTLRLGGVDTIRLTVNPVNQLALPVYRQLGCCAAGPAEANEDGQVELVSHMPRIITRMWRDHEDLVPANLRLTAAWRYQIDGLSDRALGEETEIVSGREVLRTAMRAEDFVFRAIVDPETGEILHTQAGQGGDQEPDLVLPPKPAAPAERTSTYRDGALALVLRHGDGVVEVFHDEHVGPVLRDPWPVFGPPYITGWRRGLRRELAVAPLADGWRVAEQHPDGALVRETRLAGGTLRQRVWWEGGEQPSERVRTVLVNGLRAGLLVTSGRDAAGYVPAGRGLYPIDATEFGAAGLQLEPGSALAWWDARTGLAVNVRWPQSRGVFCADLAQARMITEGLLALDVRPGSAYRVEFTTASEPGEVLRGGGEPRPERGMKVEAAEPAGHCISESDDVPDNGTAVAGAAVWESRLVARRPVHRLTAAADTLLLSAEAGGAVSWQSHGRQVLATPFPKSRVFARNPQWQAGIWVTRHDAREDPVRGLGWGTSGGAGWSFDSRINGLICDGLAWSLEPAADGVRIGVSAGPREQDGELVVWLTPAAAKNPAFLMPGVPGELWRVDKPGAWQRWTDRLAVQLADGRWLLCASTEPGTGEILVRSTPSGPLLALVTRHAGGRAGSARWPLAVLADARAASARLLADPSTHMSLDDNSAAESAALPTADTAPPVLIGAGHDQP